MENLSNIFLFCGLTDSQKEKIISNLNKPIKFKKGECIYSKEKFPNAIGYILKGEAYAVANNQNSLYMKNFVKGDCFGAAAVFSNDENFVSSITAKTDLTVLFISEKELEKIFLEYPLTSLNYIKFLSDKIRFLNKRLGLLSSGKAEDTILNYLKAASDEEGIAQIPDNMTRLSKTLGISRASLYRCLDALESGGFILKEKNIIKVIKNEKNS